jgi:hypothetical protein
LNFHARSRSRSGGCITTAPSSCTLWLSGRVSVMRHWADSVFTDCARSASTLSAAESSRP